MKMLKSAVFSDCMQYRYSITRTWDETKPYVVFIGLNPSYADAEKDDRTMGRCISFAKSWGWGGVRIVNLFAYIHTNRFEMMRMANSVGSDNDRYIVETVANAGLVVAAWGDDGRHLNRSDAVRALLPPDTKCFKINATGEPKHPLLVHRNAVLIPFT
ncbi:DUF1643 domain-containing protein [Citrobacter freundii]|uniref:DUF1643 domain-containing protein n=1 Tax=Citrobacter sp. LUTT5 TaxID=2697370 RepID=UPI0013621DB4|nr:DUF1643 domain-containing protein [Citrobacter sp. LUTT5]EKX4155104.1 DUF1643 domain-containing protein [Citrobacter freundii]QHI81548.1 DUF1643 domain-containing protein [Citrobacter sp. LUTT5]